MAFDLLSHSSLHDVVDEPGHELVLEQVLPEQSLGVLFLDAAIPDAVRIDDDGGPFAAAPHAPGSGDADVAVLSHFFQEAPQLVDERYASAIGAVGIGANEH